MLVAVLLAIVPPMIIDISSSTVWMDWVKRGLVFLVVSCPCALVISVPLSFFGGIGGASKKGILIKGSGYMELLSKADTFVFDKTGTLTKGGFEVSELVPSNGMDSEELLRITAHIEAFSNHPIARSIVSAYGKDINKELLSEINEISGHGVEAIFDGVKYYVGNKRLMYKVHPEISLEGIAGTAVFVATDDRYLGRIIVEDMIKSNAKNAIAELKANGVSKTVMLTGDSFLVAEKVGNAIKIDEIHAELLPDQKVEQVEKLLDTNTDGKVVFVGDGINDAPVLMRADIGIAMGALGSDSAIEASDVVLMDDDLEKLALAKIISRKTMRLVYENITFALAVKLIVLALSAFGFASMWLAVIADVGVMVLAILNAMRALKVGRSSKHK